MLGLSDAVRPLLDPTAIQDVVARMLAEHLGVSRCYYAEYDEDAGLVTIHRDFVRAGLPSMRGVYPMSDGAADHRDSPQRPALHDQGLAR